MANRQKQKGDREERSVVDRLRALGFEAFRTLESGARSDGSDTWDINADDLKVECKMRATGFGLIYRWIAGRDILTLRVNNKSRLWVLTEETFEKILKIKNKS